MSNTPVLDLLKDRAHWTRGAYAETEQRESVTANNPEAVRWCLLGAVNKCYLQDQRSDVLTKLLATLAESTNEVNIVTFNDHSSHEEVVSLLEQAQI